MKVTINGTFYAKVTNEANGEERVATMSITNIDSNKPVIEKLETTNQKFERGPTSEITVTVTAKDNETGIPSTGAYKWYLDNEDTPKATTDENYYTFTDIPKGKNLTHTFKVEITDNVGNIQERSTEPIEFNLLANDIIQPENYGDKIEYSANGVDDWKIFYADDNNIYIMTSDFLTMEQVPCSTYFTTEYSSSYSPKEKALSFKNNIEQISTETLMSGLDENNKLAKEFKTDLAGKSSTGTGVKAVEILFNEDNWSKLVDTNHANWAIGGATPRLYVKSWEAKYPSKSLSLQVSNYSYTSNNLSPGNTGVNDLLYTPRQFAHTNGTCKHCYQYLAGYGNTNSNNTNILTIYGCLETNNYPAAGVSTHGTVGSNNGNGIRPVVELKDIPTKEGSIWKFE